MHLLASLLLSLVIASSASAVAMDWTPIGNPGNPADPLPYGLGAVGYSYNIGTYEVTNAQYAEFLNAKAKSDPLGLYKTNMGSSPYGGIRRSGVSGSYSYSAIAGRADMPVNYVSFWDALRFANWMNNGQGSGDTETGAYTITLQGMSNNSIARNLGATIVLPSLDEWHKAAYYDAVSTSYFDWPTGSNAQTICSTPTGTANRANCGSVVGNLTIKGSYTGSAGPYGTFDQGGNVWEMVDSIFANSERGIRGGSFYDGGLAASFVTTNDPSRFFFNQGFRLAMIPEPSTGLLVIAGLVGFAGWRRAHA
jgi:formylglycine-generating enzyme required for sulfatase activity